MIRTLAPCGNMVEIAGDGTSFAACDMSVNRHASENRGTEPCRYRVIVAFGMVFFAMPAGSGWDHL